MATEETGRGGMKPGRTGDVTGRTGKAAGGAAGRTGKTVRKATEGTGKPTDEATGRTGKPADEATGRTGKPADEATGRTGKPAAEGAAGRTGKTVRKATEGTGKPADEATGRTGKPADEVTGRTGKTVRKATARTGRTVRKATARTGKTAGGAPGRTVTQLTDPRALRAYAHPIRMKLVGLLRTEGPLTATRAGELLGESSGTTSFHLRQLAKYGLVEEAGGGTGREKPWQATAAFTSWDLAADTPEVAAATGLLNTVIAEHYFEQLTRWLEASPDERPEWQEAFWFGDRIMYVTAEELAELGRRVREMVEVYFERQVRPELRPAGSRRVTYLHLAFPNDVGRGTGAH